MVSERGRGLTKAKAKAKAKGAAKVRARAKLTNATWVTEGRLAKPVRPSLTSVITGRGGAAIVNTGPTATTSMKVLKEERRETRMRHHYLPLEARRRLGKIWCPC